MEQQIKPQTINLGKLGKLGQGNIVIKAEQEPATEKFLMDFEQNPEQYLTEVEHNFPIACIDGRTGVSGNYPKIAGGSLSFLVGLNLLGVEIDSQSLFEKFKKHGLPVGGHIDDHDHSHGGTGCGANDKLSDILQKFIDPKTASDIFNTMNILQNYSYNTGNFLDTTFLSERAKQIINKTNQNSATEHMKSIEQYGKVDTLSGNHNEIAVILNNHKNTTVNVSKILNESQDVISVFNADIWCYNQASEAILQVLEDEKIQNLPSTEQLQQSVLAYTIATTATLAGENLNLLVIR